MAMFGADWRDPTRYDLIVNRAKASRDGAKLVILEAAGLAEYQPTAVSIQAFKDVALGSRVHATLFASTQVRGSSLEVRADNGQVHVKGRVDHEALADEIVRLIKNVPGVARVTTDVYAMPPETFLGA